MNTTGADIFSNTNWIVDMQLSFFPSLEKNIRSAWFFTDKAQAPNKTTTQSNTQHNNKFASFVGIKQLETTQQNKQRLAKQVLGSKANSMQLLV